MSKSNAFENEILLLILQNANIANVGDATGLRGSSSAGSLYLALHTADPGEAGDQSTNEVAYTSYARKAITRNSTEFPVSGNQASLGNAQSFPAGTGGSGTATHWSLGVASAGAGKILYKGALAASIICGAGVTPQIAAGTLLTEE